MGLVSGHPVSARRSLLVLALGFAIALAFAARAQAAELLFWSNYDAEPESISFANVDGLGGGALNLAGESIVNPEGMAYDSVTNRIFVATGGGPGLGQIIFVNLDGSGAGVFTAPGAPVEEPEGMTIDPVTRTIYWINTKDPDKISFASLDGSAGGVLNTAGAAIEGAYRMTIDPVGRRVYWGNSPAGSASVGFAKLDNSGGGTLDISGATPPKEVSGLAVDPTAGRIYWIDREEQRVSFASLGGGGGGDVNLAGAILNEPFGLALDPSLGKLYWGNYGLADNRIGAIGFASTGGGGGGITPATAAVNGAQDPLILKSPTGTGAPNVSGSATAPSRLSCSTGSWAADFAGSFVYQAPRSFAYRWSHNGAAIGGATSPTLEASAAGTYACEVTATNQAGSASQSSASFELRQEETLEAASFKLKLKTKVVKAKPDSLATFKVEALNQGQLAAAVKARLCLKAPRRAKADLKPRKCKRLAGVPAGAKRTLALKVKVKPSAEGRYRLTILVRGAGLAGKAAKATLKIVE
jgi:hypothetical protein